MKPSQFRAMKGYSKSSVGDPEKNKQPDVACQCGFVKGHRGETPCQPRIFDYPAFNVPEGYHFVRAAYPHEVELSNGTIRLVRNFENKMWTWVLESNLDSLRGRNKEYYKYASPEDALALRIKKI